MDAQTLAGEIRALLSVALLAIGVTGALLFLLVIGRICWRGRMDSPATANGRAAEPRETIGGTSDVV